MRLAVFTVCSNPQVPQAHALFETVSRFLPGADTVLILADESHPAIVFPTACTVIPARELGIHDFAGLAFRYDMMEFGAALKPFAFLHLLGACGYTHCLYFAPDIELFSPVPAIMDALAANAPFLLTPHILQPAEAEEGPDDVAVMRQGAFNLGFLGVSGTSKARDVLAWWARWLRSHCVNDKPIGLFIDQKFVDLVPGFAPGTRILHDPGLNVAHWNLAQRRFVPDAPAGPLVEGGPLGFFHYSGFDPAWPDRLSSETDQFRGGALPGSWRAFLGRYADRLVAAGHGQVPPDCYAYRRFASGVPIPTIARRLFRDDRVVWAGDPFGSFEAWAHLPALQVVPGLGTAMPSVLMHWLQARDPALAGFSPYEAAGAEDLTRWWLEHGVSTGMDRRFLEPQALAAGLRPVSIRANYPDHDAGRADATVIAPLGEDSPAGNAGRASRQAMAGRVDTLDIRADEWSPVTGRLLAVCLAPGQLASTLDAVSACLPPDAYRVFIPASERVPISPAFLGALGQVDEVWAPTRFIQASLVLATDLPVLHMPVAWRFPAAASATPPPGQRRYILAECDDFPGCGEVLTVVRAYQAAFGARPVTDRPALVIHAAGTGEWDPALLELMRASGSVVAPDPSDTAALVAGAACVLSLHRGEALGLRVARAMAAGVPVVATEYGGCTDLLSPETGFPVEFSLRPEPGAPASDPAWAEADLHHAAWSLRDVFGRPEEAGRRAANARRAIAAAHDPAVIAARQAARLEAVRQVMCRLRNTVPA